MTAVRKLRATRGYMIAALRESAPERVVGGVQGLGS